MDSGAVRHAVSFHQVTTGGAIMANWLVAILKKNKINEYEKPLSPLLSPLAAAAAACQQMEPIMDPEATL